MNKPVSLDVFSKQNSERVNRLLADALKKIPPRNQRLLDAMSYSLLDGGKRVRPLLCYASAEALAPETPISALTDAAACALECIHVYSLIHDDLPAMDDDDLRRGKPTNHLAFDEATAILAGDALQSMAFELLANAQGQPHQIVAMLQTLGKASGAQGMVMGQAVDLAAVNTNQSLSALETMHRHKTGALIEAAVSCGAISVGADTNQLASLKHYAQAIGLAFQVQDDILDVTADTATLGKTQGADANHNKPTYVSLLGLQAAQSKAKNLIQEAIETLSSIDLADSQLANLARYVGSRTH